MTGKSSYQRKSFDLVAVVVDGIVAMCYVLCAMCNAADGRKSQVGFGFGLWIEQGCLLSLKGQKLVRGLKDGRVNL